VPRLIHNRPGPVGCSECLVQVRYVAAAHRPGKRRLWVSRELNPSCSRAQRLSFCFSSTAYVFRPLPSALAAQFSLSKCCLRPNADTSTQCFIWLRLRRAVSSVRAISALGNSSGITDRIGSRFFNVRHGGLKPSSNAFSGVRLTTGRSRARCPRRSRCRLSGISGFNRQGFADGGSLRPRYHGR
jgi:hypothetical protein